MVLEVVVVRVARAAVLVEVLVDQVGPDEQVAVAEDLVRPPVGQHAPVLAEDDDPVGDERHDVQLVGRGDERPAARARAGG